MKGNSMKAGRLYRRLILGIAALLVMSGMSVGLASPANAHVGDITVTNAVCVDASTMTATYRVGWTNGTAPFCFCYN